MPSSSFANFDTYKNCAYYSDTIGATNAEGGTVVVDVSDPRKPVQTAYLTERAAANAGESLRVHRERGLLVADRYYLAPGRQQLRRPRRQPLARHLRHLEGLPQAEAARRRRHAVGDRPRGLLPGRRDGLLHGEHRHDHADRHLRSDASPSSCRSRRTSGSTAARPARTASAPTSPTSGPARLVVADTSEVQARKENAQIKVIGELPTPGNDGQQSTIPIFYDGRPHIFNFAEYAELGQPCASRPDRETNFGYPMIVDIADERNPKVVSKIFNEVTLPENCAAVAADSAAFPSQRADQGRHLRRRRLARLPLRLALLLDRPHARPDDRRVRELRLRHPRLRHPQPARRRRRSPTSTRARPTRRRARSPTRPSRGR